MEIKSFRLENLGRFQQVNVELAPTEEVNANVTVFIGNNGAGKTSILKALTTSLSWFVARLRNEKGNGTLIPEDVILNGQPSAMIEITIEDKHANTINANDEDRTYKWSVARTKSGKKAALSSNLNDVNRLADFYRVALTNDSNANLPLIAFYPVERVVIDVPLRIKGRHSFFQLDGYDNSLKKGVDFRRFFEWFREREDSENESNLPKHMLEELHQKLAHNTDALETLHTLIDSSKDKQLNAVRNAIYSFMVGFNNLRVRRKPRLHMSIDKDGQTLNVLQLSQGEKSLMALVGDIARRLAITNPDLDNPLNGDGIVLIDEVDMHLHPSWQRNIISRLTTTFPHCQFILTTHSPLVISDYKNVLVYSIDQDGINVIPSQFGEDANTVLLNVMNTHIRNIEITQKINDLLDLIQEAKNQETINHARNKLAELSNELSPNNLEIIKANMFLKKRVLQHEKNN